ncbi:MAG: alpha/beta fold hydrolase [Corynebacterium sp.]|nr:alpha/beta fold hydrolase [Corynebacterium sp.]
MLHFSVSGKPGQPLVVMLHGVSNSGLWWAPLTEELGEDFHVMALDALGHGQSRRFTPAELADPFAATVREAIITITYISEVTGQVPLLVGHSMGGAVATVIADQRPDLVSGLLLADPAWLTAQWASTFRANASDAVTRTAAWAADPAEAITENRIKRPSWQPVDHVGWVWGQSRVDLGLVETGIVSFSEDWLSVIKRITVPLVALTSDGEDCLVGQAGVDAVRKLSNPCVSIRLIPGGTHAMVPEFRRELLVELQQLSQRVHS